MRFLIQKINDLKITQIKHGQYTDITDKNVLSEQLVLSPPKSAFLIYVGVEKGDEKKDLEEIVEYLENLQIIEQTQNDADLTQNEQNNTRNFTLLTQNIQNDPASSASVQYGSGSSKFSKTIKEVKPQLIFVSNITLVADFEKGRINFNQSLDKKLAKEIYEKFIEIFKNKGYQVFSTPFGSYLQITSTNLGPINFHLQI